MKHSFYLIILIGMISGSLFAQNTNGLRAYFPFDDCLLIDETGLQTDAVPGFSNVSCICSVQDSGIVLNGGVNDHLTMNGN